MAVERAGRFIRQHATGLGDEGPGDGGVAVIPGSHKANLPCPDSMKAWEKYQEHVLELNGQAGDVVIFTETLTHGTLPWNGAHERRALLYKFSPGSLAYGSGAHAVDYPDYIGDMSEEERTGAIRAAIKAIEDANKGETMEVTVKSMYYGNEFYVIV